MSAPVDPPETEIEGAGLSTRSRNALRRGGYTTLAAVRAATDQDLMDIRGLGWNCLVEIRQVIGGPGPGVTECPTCGQPVARTTEAGEADGDG